MDSHSERDDPPEPQYEGSRGAVIAAVIIGLIFLGIVVLHLAGGGFAPHGP